MWLAGDYHHKCYNFIMTKTIINNQDFLGTLWMIGWLFSIGFLRLSFWKGVLALIVWPYYLGVKFRKDPEIK
jgi:hypothetical protein